MGHGWREMDPKGAEAHDRRIERRNKIFTEIEKMSLSFLTVGEFLILCRLLDDRASDTDLAILERKIDEFAGQSSMNQLRNTFCHYCGANIKGVPDHRC